MSMGEAPDFCTNDLSFDHLNEHQPVSKGYETAVTIDCNKTYYIGGMENEVSSTISVRIFNKSSGKWQMPVVIGAKPKAPKGHSCIHLDDDQILVIKENSSCDDCFWFLELDTPFVREQKMKLGIEVIARSKGVIDMEKPIVISGPSGVGKGTLIAKLMEEFPSMFGFSVSHTTRSPRNHEQNRVHYHFTKRSVMEKDIQDGKFLEYADVHGNLYGTSVEAVKMVTNKGMRCILDIDVQGARSVRASSLEAIFIFVCPPSYEELEKRLRARGTETEEQIQKRLRNAKAELEQGNSPGLFDHILVNDDLDSCYIDLKKLLGLPSGTNTGQTSLPELFDVPLPYTTSRIEHKIQISYGAAEEDESDEKILVLDISSIKGDVAGERIGLKLHSVAPSRNSIHGANISS